MKKQEMQKWAYEEMQRNLELAAEEMEAEELELRYAASRNPRGVRFWLQRRKRRKDLADEVAEELRLWSSGLVLNLVDFAILLEEMRDFRRNLAQQDTESPELKPGNSRDRSPPPSC